MVGLYGHFAEPKRKFTVKLENLAPNVDNLSMIIKFFTLFDNCGRNIPTYVLLQSLGVSKEILESCIRQMRYLRYDLRSHLTNSRIPENHYFCAYPFPELSAAYQVKKPV